MNYDNAKEFEQFNKIIDDFAHSDAVEHVLDWHKKLVFEGLRRLTGYTPVDLGYARGGWQVGLEGFPAPTSIGTGMVHLEESEANQLTTKVIDKGKREIAKIKPFTVTFIVNQVHYIIYLEDGSSDQRPNGMLTLVIDELAELVA